MTRKFEVARTGATGQLRLLGGIPRSATEESVRFRKGEAMWELAPRRWPARRSRSPCPTERPTDSRRHPSNGRCSRAGKVVGVGGGLVS
ncbi:MAG: hypothetical protein QM733_01635 [Ilumatobacteraceae bacterium]